MRKRKHTETRVYLRRGVTVATLAALLLFVPGCNTSGEGEPVPTEVPVATEAPAMTENHTLCSWIRMLWQLPVHRHW